MKIVRFQDRSGYLRTGFWTDSGIEAAGQKYNPEKINILPPVQPTKIVCLGDNYIEHLKERGFKIPQDIPERPQLFLKSPNTVIGHRDTIVLPEVGIDSRKTGDLGDIETGKRRIDYEAELGVVMKRQAKKVSEKEAMEYIMGFTCVNDISNRDDQSVERNWVRGKSFDNAAPIGPVVASTELVSEDPRVRLILNGETKQDSKNDEFIFSVPEVIAEITRFLTLEPGDIIAMGTPSGVGPLSHGDKVEVKIEGIGTLVNFVQKRE